MKAVIISSSDGTRLRPLTCSTTHCMLPVMGRPVIEHTVRLLMRCNVKNITIVSSYLGEEMKKHFSGLAFNDIELNFSEESNLDTFFKTDDVLLISDSLLTDISFDELISLHSHCGCDATVVTKHTSTPFEYGVIQVNREGFVSSYMRCPDFAQPAGIPFMGIAVIKKGTSSPDSSSIGQLLENLTKNNMTIYNYTPDCYIRDICNFESYHRVCRDFLDKKISLPFPCEEKAPSVWIDENAVVMQGSVISPPVYIGPGSVINKGARIDAYSQILRDVTVECYASIKRSIVMDNSHICENAALRGAIIGKNCSVGFESSAYEGSVLGFGSKTGKHCTLRTSVHIWPDKFLEDESCISENIIWEKTSLPSLFSDGCANGVINRDITPEFAVKLGRNAAAMLGGKIAVSCDGERGGSMIKNALIAGIQSAGAVPYDLGEQPLPLTRSAVKFYSLCGAIALSTYKCDSSLCGCLDIINKNGANLETGSIKKLEKLIQDSPQEACIPQNICESEFLFEYKLYYLKQLVNSTSKKPLGMRVLIYTSSQWACELLQSAASDLDCTFSFTQSSDKELFSKEVLEGDFDFGAICDPKCETLTLVTKNGTILSEFDYCALTSLIIMKDSPSAAIYVPSSAPESIEALALMYGATVHRTQLSPPHIMNKLSKSIRKPFLHQFIYRFDAVGAIIILADFLYTHKTTIENLLSEIPPTSTVTDTVDCPKNEQDKILSGLYSRFELQLKPQADAVRIDFDDGWVLVAPQQNKSFIKIISHSTDKEYAREIADICIDDIIDNNERYPFGESM